MTASRISEPERSTPIHGRYEVVVLGGGPAGLAAAAAAGQKGRRTLLIERYGFSGGMGTAAGVTNFCGLFANVHGDIQRVVFGTADELLDRIDETRRPQRAARGPRQDQSASLRHRRL